ncbi:MAG: T9SS type A sorting domain-containing protein [Cytophagales bacterium]|nr:T9SS type A sorting domain-containing protein [Cytophagales bacterium]
MKIQLLFFCSLIPFLFSLVPATAQEVDTTLWVTDGPVEAMVRSGGIIYIGGSFSYVGPSTGNGVTLNAATGRLTQTPALGVAGEIRTAIPDGKGGWYLGGTFTVVQGKQRTGLAHILPNGLLDSDWAPVVSGGEPGIAALGTVLTLALRENTVYAGGNFTEANGQTRNYLAAFDAVTGQLSGWNPGADALIHKLTVSENTLYAAGRFTAIDGQPRNYVAAFDAASGGLKAWNPGIVGREVVTIAVANHVVYVGGYFTAAGGQQRANLAALDPITGQATGWNPGPSAYVHALAFAGDVVYVAGSFDRIGGRASNGLAGVSATTGIVTAWDPGYTFANTLTVAGNTLYIGGHFTAAAGQERYSLAAFDVTTGQLTDWNPGCNGPVYTLSVQNDAIFAGGLFSSVNGKARNRIAAIDAATGQPTAWNPDADNYVSSLAVSGNTVYAGGIFTSIGGQNRTSIAALDASTGRATAWNPGGSGNVKALVVAGNLLYAGGGFDKIGGQSRFCIAALDLTTGAATAWNPGMGEGNAAYSINAVAVGAKTVYVGGTFQNIGGRVRNNIAAIDAVTGQPTAWNPDVDGQVFTLALSNNLVYAGGMFGSVGGQSRSHIAAIDATTGRATSWNPSAGSTPSAIRYVRSLATAGNVVYAGGYFTFMGGQNRNYVVALDTATGRATGWNAGLDNFLSALAVYDGVVYLGGYFTKVGSRPIANFAAFGKKTSNPNYIRGTIYEDSNANCVRNDGEKAVANAVVVAQPGNYFASTDSLGNYTLAVDTGSYVVSQVIPHDQAAVIRQVCPVNAAGHAVRFPGLGSTVTGKDFANRLDLRSHLTVSVSSNRRRRCFTNATTIAYCNNGTVAAAQAKVYLKLPQHVVPVSTTVPYTRDQNQDLVFDVGTLAAGACGSIQLTDSVVCNDPNIRGLTQCTRAWITPANAQTPGVEWDGSDLALKARCGNNGRVRLGLYNTGTGSMTDSTAYRVYLDAQLAFTRNYKLAKGDSLILQVPANGRTVRLEADQRSGHPTKQSTNVTLEACGTNAQGGVSLGYVAQLPGDDAEPEVAEECLPIIDSFDPNDKAVSPGGVTDGHYTPTRSRLDYVIRFQNTGTDVAYKVVVVDTLSADLDVSTLQLGSVSHPYAMKVSGKGRPVLTFTLNNILLPDSNANEPKSHGYIQFSIKPKADLLEKTRIENFADIFFDYNEPVRTNTTFNTLYDLPPVPAETVKLDGTVVCVATNTTVTVGSSRTVCVQDTAVLAAILPAQGGGRWRSIGGTATVTDPGNPAAQVAGLAYGNNVFEWRVAANTCGTDSLAGRVTITRLRRPATPAITQRGADSLACSVAAGTYEWYFEGSPLGVRTRVIKANQAGKYTVRVGEESGCPSEPSPAFAWLPTGVEPHLALPVRVYPNPTTGAFVVVLPPDLGPPVRVTLSDPVGRALAVRTLPPGTRGEQVVQFDLSAGQKGFYLLKLQTTKGVVVRKVYRQ